MNGPTFECGAPRHGTGADRERALLEIVTDFGREAVRSSGSENLTFGLIDLATIGSAKPGGIFNECFEDGLELER
jgi:hypothetical protein